MAQGSEPRDDPGAGHAATARLPRAMPARLDPLSPAAPANDDGERATSTPLSLLLEALVLGLLLLVGYAEIALRLFT